MRNNYERVYPSFYLLSSLVSDDIIPTIFYPRIFRVAEDDGDDRGKWKWKGEPWRRRPVGTRRQGGVTKAMTQEAGDTKSERTMGRCDARWGGSIRP